MKNPIQNFFFHETNYFSEKIEFLTGSSYWRVFTEILFYRNFVHLSYVPMSTKRCLGFFKFCLDREFMIKIKKDPVSIDSLKPVFLCIFISNLRSEKN